MRTSHDFQKAKRRYNVLMRDYTELQNSNRSDPELEAVIRKLLAEFPELNPSFRESAPFGSPCREDSCSSEALKNEKDISCFLRNADGSLEDSRLCNKNSSLEPLEKEDNLKLQLVSELPCTPQSCTTHCNRDTLSWCQSSSAAIIPNPSPEMLVDDETVSRLSKSSDAMRSTIERADKQSATGIHDVKRFSFLRFWDHRFLFLMYLIIAFQKRSRFDHRHASHFFFLSVAISIFHRLFTASPDSDVRRIVSPVVCCLPVHLHNIYSIFARRSTSSKGKEKKDSTDLYHRLAYATIYLVFDVVPSLAFVLVIYVSSITIMDVIEVLGKGGLQT